MRTLLRRIRGIVGMGLTWSMVWALAGAAYGVTAVFVYDDLTPLADVVFPSSISWATYGFALGSLFACVLAVGERRRSLEQLATRRMALWGGIAGALLPLSFIALAATQEGIHLNNGFVGTILSTLLGAGCAAASFRLARAGLSVESAAEIGEGEYRTLPASGAEPAPRGLPKFNRS
jgi:hypothetical protein